ncbi:hypothetical protein [Calidithermus chliarophilus]|uniref:hypothetical protein n=1 Tax=Calidithermus chliarophilus TaxID=52023 RepID=UPI0003F9898F|nr:hypothetical protein [Calidithermus chliarophilus]
MNQLGNTLRKLPQSTKVALAGLLFAGLVGVWYLVASQVGQPADTAVTPTTPVTPPEGTVPARSLEVVPLPFLKAETTPGESPAPEAQSGPAQPAQASPGPTAPGRLQVQAPPNPFMPLFPEEVPPSQQPTVTATATQPTPPPVVAQTPPPTRAIPSGPRVQVRPVQTPLPSPNIRVTAPAPTPRPTATPTTAPAGSGSQARLPAANPRAGASTPAPAPSLSGGALPLRLAPLDREVPTAQATQPTQPQVAQPGEANLGGSTSLPPVGQQGQPNPTLEPKATPTTPATTPVVKTPVVSVLTRFVQEQNLRLVGVVLGPTSVGIFQGKNGFFVLPVGRNFPESEVLLKTLTAREALLVQGSESLTLELVNP